MKFSLQNEGLEPILKKHDSTKNERALKKNSQLTDPLVVEVIRPRVRCPVEGLHGVDDVLQDVDVIAIKQIRLYPLVLAKLVPGRLEVGLDVHLQRVIANF